MAVDPFDPLRAQEGRRGVQTELTRTRSMEIRSLARSRIILGALLSLILVCAVQTRAQTESTRGQAWVLGSKLALAGTLHAQGGEPALVNRQFAAATAAADRFWVKLPALPARKANRVEDSANVLNYLLNQTGGPIGTILARSHGTEHAAIFEIALKSNILLMMYGPGESTTTVIANLIRDRQTKADLPPVMFDALLNLIGKQASYEAVKSELFRIHDKAPQFIAVLDFGKTGEQLYTAGNALGSAAEFTKAIAVDPTGPEHYFLRGRAYLKLGKHAEAIADYSKFLQLEGPGQANTVNRSVAYHNRGLSFGITGKNSLALGDLDEAIKLRPDYASAYRLRGLVYKQMGNQKASSADLARAEQLQPGITK